MKYYPVFLNLKNKKSVVVGGGRVAERKVRTLLKAGALVKIISPEITRNLWILKDKGKIKHIKRAYKTGDTADAFVVIACTSSTEVNTQIAREAGHLVNVIDLPSEGNFIAPSIVRRGPLTIAISTEGASPAISKAVRKEMEKLYDKEFACYLKVVEVTRKKAMKKLPDTKKREKFLKSLASENIFRILRKNGFRAASEYINQRLCP
ncbi:MAG: bifunctional precorrin-2 dehydrogenase/sirohydrochlorin ferrochelatase [Nitrospirae bacterium]|nr:bifunctional precorrin-2 dehydrogenase/sirohydrochlorin ferrochelatase [Nitrospirota bacterium]